MHACSKRMSLSKSLFLVVELLLVIIPSFGDYTCTTDEKNFCKANCVDGSELVTLDISNIFSYPYTLELDAKDANAASAQSFIFSCSSYQCGNTSDTSVCMIGETGSSSKTSCGQASSDTTTYSLTRTSPNYFFTVLYAGGYCEHNLQCLSSQINFLETEKTKDTSIEFTRSGSGENGAKRYVFDVTGPNVGQPGGGARGGGSGSPVGYVGLVLIIIALIAVLVYFVGGGLILRYSRGAVGKEVIPHVYFWMSLPGLIKDGCLFVTSPCRRSSTSYYTSL